MNIQTSYTIRGKQKKPLAFWGNSTQTERWRAVIQHTPLGVRVLDLGTGRGSYVDALGIHGFSAVGVDLYHYPEWHTEKNGLFANATAFKLPFKNKSFHTTIAFEVIEHCHDPHLVLQEIARCTTNQLILSVPNCSLDNRLRRYDLAMAHWTDPTHCNFFTKESIQDVLRQEEFQVLEVTDCYRIVPSNYFWDTLLLPRRITNIFKQLCLRLNLVEIYWSSILVVANVRPDLSEVSA